MVVVDKEDHPVGLVDRQILLEALASVPPEIA
jgi:predicted transcriptional regulator